MNYYKKCERCHDYGLRDDEDCPYYGEPCGCNHPQHGYARGGTPKVQDEIIALKNEIASLRAALKPVLACDLSKFGDGFCYVDLFEAVLEAKRIYNESEVK